MTQIRFIEVFSGCGGLSLGLTHANLVPVLLVDNNKDCVATLRLNHENNIVKLADVKEFHIDSNIYSCDILVGGIPCQAFSQAGKRKGLEDPRGSLFFDFARLIEECDPMMFVVENVNGLTTINKGETLQQILRMLNVNDRYNVTYKVLNAIDYEVPQKRKRIIIVGTKKEFPNFEFPKAIDKRLVLRDVLSDCPASDGVQYSENKKKIMELIPPGGCWVNLPDELQKQYMGKSYKSGGGKRGIARRLSLDEPCLTLTTSPCQKQTERCHPIETRPFTVREYARIQTFPDTYAFYGSTASKYRQIGNAVPVKLAYHLGISIKHFIESIKEDEQQL